MTTEGNPLQDMLNRMIANLSSGQPEQVELPDHIREEMTSMGMNPDNVVHVDTIQVAPGLNATAYVVKPEGQDVADANLSDVADTITDQFNQMIGGSFTSPGWWDQPPETPFWWQPNTSPPPGPSDAEFTFTAFDDPKPEGVVLTYDEMQRASSLIAVLEGTDDFRDGLERHLSHYVSEIVVNHPDGSIAGSVIKVDGEWVYNKDNA